MPNVSDFDPAGNVSDGAYASKCNEVFELVQSTGEWKSAVTASVLLSAIAKVIACPFTVLFNLLVIYAGKKRPSLQSNTNILLACLAVTDVLTGPWSNHLQHCTPARTAWQGTY